jgi:hypothetical protein
VAPPIVAPLVSATVSTFSAPSSPGTTPTASDLAFEDPALVNGGLFSVQGLEAGTNQTVGTTV